MRADSFSKGFAGRCFANTLAAGSLFGLAGIAQAGDFNFSNGIDGRFSLTVSTGTAVRTADAQRDLIGPNNSFAAGQNGLGGSNTTDDGNRNFKKGDSFSTTAKAIGELNLRKDDTQFFMRVKALRDLSLTGNTVPHGSTANGYVPNQKLLDQGYEEPLSQFSSAKVLDAYVSQEFEYMEGKRASIKVGNQAVNWGEALFVLGGVNQFGRLDAVSARRPDVQLKEIFSPIPQITTNIGIADGLSVEAFYQLKNKSVIVDGCGTFFSPSDLLNCNQKEGVLGAGDARLANPLTGAPVPVPGFAGTSISAANYNCRSDRELYNGAKPCSADELAAVGFAGGDANNASNQALGPVNFRLPQLASRKAKDGGQFGLSSRYFSNLLGTEFGFYYVNYHQRLPALGLTRDKSFFQPIVNSFWNATGNAAPLHNAGVVKELAYFFDYSAQRIKVLGMSAATEMGGFSLFGEVTRTSDFPVAYNSVDFVRGVATGRGPLADLFGDAQNTGLIKGYDLKSKTQIQMSTIRSFPRVLAAESLTLIAEAGFQKWDGISKDASTGVRYGRGVVYGYGDHSSQSGADGGNPNPNFREAKGYATPTAYGYRTLLQLSYPNAIAGINLRPRFFFSHDVKGYSADGVFIEDRKSIGLSLRGEYASRYFGEMGYNKFDKKAKYDPFRDHDFATLVFGATF